MREIELQAIPNQSLSILLDQIFYEIAVKETNGVMAFSISRNSILIISNLRAVAGFPIIPYRYKENGNFAVVTMNEEIPYYTQFGITQKLIYASVIDLGVIRAGA